MTALAPFQDLGRGPCDALPRSGCAGTALSVLAQRLPDRIRPPLRLPKCRTSESRDSPHSTASKTSLTDEKEVLPIRRQCRRAAVFTSTFARCRSVEVGQFLCAGKLTGFRFRGFCGFRELNVVVLHCVHPRAPRWACFLLSAYCRRTPFASPAVPAGSVA